MLVTVYIRKADEQRWKSLENKAAVVSWAINNYDNYMQKVLTAHINSHINDTDIATIRESGVTSPDNISPPVKRIIKTPKDAEKVVSKGVYCKHHKAPNQCKVFGCINYL